MTFSTVYNFLHILSIVTWIGGMIFMNIIFMPSLSAVDPPQRNKLLGVVTHRFTSLAWGSIILMVVTGILITPTVLLFNVSNFYGVILTLKHLVVLTMIVVAVIITFVISPKMQSLAPAPGEQPNTDFFKTQKQLSILARMNMVLGILTLLFVAML